MRTLNRFTTLLALTLTLAGGCDEAVDFAEPVAEGDLEFRPLSCTWCTTIGNSPVMNGTPFDYIVPMGSNNVGMKMVGGFVGLDNYSVGVDPATERFFFYDLNDQDVYLSGADLVGAKIVFEMVNTAQVVHLEILDVDANVASWATGAPPQTFYRASYFDKGVPTPLCQGNNPDAQWFTLISDELYDPVTHAISPANGAVTVACVGQAAAKMKLFDYHPRGTKQATVDQRLATLRMITADYCGDGTSFTQAGVHVAWRNLGGEVQPPYAEKSMEAYWGPNGAICLTRPRVVAIDDVLERCAIPSCADVDDVGDAEWRTMLPE